MPDWQMRKVLREPGGQVDKVNYRCNAISSSRNDVRDLMRKINDEILLEDFPGTQTTYIGRNRIENVLPDGTKINWEVEQI